MCIERSVGILAKQDPATNHPTLVETFHGRPAPLDLVGGGRSQRALRTVRRWRRPCLLAVWVSAAGLPCCRPLGAQVCVKRSSDTGKKTRG